LWRLVRVSISDTTVWRQHGEVSQRIEAMLREEEAVASRIAQRGEARQSERIGPRDPISEHVSVSIDGVTVLIRDQGYKEVKMVAVSEARVTEPKPAETTRLTDRQGTESESEQTEAGGEGQRSENRGRQDGLKLGRHSYRAILGDKVAFSPVLAAELAVRRVHRAIKVTTVNDGSDWIWDLALTHLPAQRVEVLDWPHGMVHIWKAGQAGLGVGTELTRAWVMERETELWEGRVTDVQAALKKLPRRRGERGKAIRQVREYVATHGQRMEYARYREEGRPIGSGTIESGAKNVVAWRMKRGGQSWGDTGALRMLAALGEVHSLRWDARLAEAA
jgi:hypothetical protein